MAAVVSFSFLSPQRPSKSQRKRIGPRSEQKKRRRGDDNEEEEEREEKRHEKKKKRRRNFVINMQHDPCILSLAQAIAYVRITRLSVNIKSYKIPSHLIPRR